MQIRADRRYKNRKHCNDEKSVIYYITKIESAS